MKESTFEMNHDTILNSSTSPSNKINLETANEDINAQRKAERKAAKKATKATRRAERQGIGDPTAGQKACDRCQTLSDLLIRCQYKESNGNWLLICGKCWKYASGGVVDGDDDHPDYCYGGLWKNRRKQEPLEYHEKM